MAVSPSGYATWKTTGKPSRQVGKRLSDAQLLTLIRAIHARTKGAYGSPRIFGELKDAGHPVSKGRVERLMREHGIRARHKRRFKATTDSSHWLPVAPNLLDRQFTQGQPNAAWVADITYIPTGEGWLYLAVVLDLFDRAVVGWSIKPRMTCSMSRKGTCWDNAVAESFFNSLKNERVHDRRYATRDEARADLFDYIEVFYNRRRRHSALQGQNPTSVFEAWQRHQEKLVA
jgi:putative transposase